LQKKAVLGIVLALLLANMITLAFNIQPVRAAGTIYIRADGSVDPPSAPILNVGNVYYTFTDNINDSLVVERDNIVVDGAGHILQGAGGTEAGNGVSLTGRSNVTIRKMSILNFTHGICLNSSSGNALLSNNVIGNFYTGIWLDSYSNGNSVFANNITNTRYMGIQLYYSSNNNITANNITNNLNTGIFLSYFSNNNSISANGMSLNLYECIYLSWYSNNNSIFANEIVNNTFNGIRMAFYCSGNIVFENNVANHANEGIRLHSNSNYNSVSENRLTNNSYGTCLTESSYNSLYSNTITNSAKCGLFLSSSSSNSISANTIANNGDGVCLYASSHNSISANSVTNHTATMTNIGYGIYSQSSSDNYISANNITNNWYGLFLYNSSYNSVSENNMTYCHGGIEFSNSSYNSISANELKDNYSGMSNVYDVFGFLDIFGVPSVFGSSSNNVISANNLIGQWLGISLLNSSNNNNISGNSMTSNYESIRLDSSSHNVISSNNIAYSSYSGYGIYLNSSSYNSIRNNNLTNNGYGIWLNSSSSNLIWHNNFVGNTFQAYVLSSNCTWDDGYPSGGNYWSDYAGVDLYRGSYQNVTGSDGIGDTPHVIDANNTDKYPLMHQEWWKDSILDFVLSPNPVLVGKTVVLQGNLTDRLGQPLNNIKVDLYVNGAYAASLFTNFSGWFKASAPVTSLGTFTINVTYAGSANYNPSWHAETLTVATKLDTKVSLSLTPNPVKVGQTVTLKANLTDVGNTPIGSAPLELWLKIGAGSWQYVATFYTNSTGWVQASGTVGSTGTYQVALVYRGTSQYSMSYKIVTLTVGSFLFLDSKIEFTLSPNPAPAGQAITLEGTLTDEYDNPIIAPPGGTLLLVSVSNPAVASFPATITIPEGMAAFSGQGWSIVEGECSITISYSGGGTNPYYNPSNSTQTLTVTG
jgi:parallel beta-helix repeat protein